MVSIIETLFTSGSFSLVFRDGRQASICFAGPVSDFYYSDVSRSLVDEVKRESQAGQRLFCWPEGAWTRRKAMISSCIRNFSGRVRRKHVFMSWWVLSYTEWISISIDRCLEKSITRGNMSDGAGGNKGQAAESWITVTASSHWKHKKIHDPQSTTKIYQKNVGHHTTLLIVTRNVKPLSAQHLFQTVNLTGS